MSLRTLRNWMRLDPAEPAAPPGRRRTSEAVLDEARDAVRAQLEMQGWATGEEPVWRALGGRLPRARVRRVLRDLKAARRRRLRCDARERRVSITVCARDAAWSMDATHLGRDPSGHEVQAEVLRDVASTRTIALSVGPAAHANDVVRLLDRAVRVRGGAPLVLITDNGGAYRSAAVTAWCFERGVLHLFSLPRTPQHNPWSEHGMLELKADAALGKGVVVPDALEARARLRASRERIDGARLRASRGWLTAVEADRRLPHWSRFTTREQVLTQATCAIRQALLDCTTGRARRRAIREAILSTLQRFSVITRTRGGRPWNAQGAEGDS